MKFCLRSALALAITLLILVGCSRSMRMKTNRVNPKEGCVIIYKDCNYEGPKVEMCEDQPDFRIFNFRDQASAISIGKNVKVQLFEERLYLGRSAVITRDESCFAFNSGLTGFNDRVNSLKIIPIPPNRPNQGCVRIFEKCHFTGISYEFCVDRPLFPIKYFNSKTVSSVWVGENTELQLFMQPGLTGQSKSFSQDFECLDTCLGWMSNQAKSASVFTVVKTQKKFTEEEMKKLQNEENLEEEKKKKEAQPDYFSIKYATYGLLDITEKIRSLVNIENHSLTFSAFNDSFGSTLNGVFKTSHVFYWGKGNICVAGVKDNEILEISVDKGGNCYPVSYTQRRIRVLAAVYGGKDITLIMRDMFEKNDKLTVLEPKLSMIGFDPLPGWAKTFSIFYEVDGIRVKKTVLEGERIDLLDEAKKQNTSLAEKEKAEAEEKVKAEKEEKDQADAKKKAEEEEKRQEDIRRKAKQEEQMRFSIIDAQYGPNFVTNDLKKRQVGDSFVFKIYDSFPTLPEDYLKMATVFYWSNSRICYKTIKGDEAITIDVNVRADDNIYCHPKPADNTKVQVFIATFGGSDITNMLRLKTQDTKFGDVRASSYEFGKPLPGWQNPLLVYYSIEGYHLTKLLLENEKINFYEEIEKAKKDEDNKKIEIEKAIEEAKKEQENKKYLFSIAGVSYGPMEFTDYVSSLVKDESVTFMPWSGIFGNTWISKRKTLQMFFWRNNKICVLNEYESSRTIFVSRTNPGGANCHEKPNNPDSYITVYAASFGTTDITMQLRNMFNGKKREQTNAYVPNLKDFGMELLKDGLINRTLSVYFSINNTFFFTVITDGDHLDFLKIYEKWTYDKEKDKDVVKKAEIVLATYGTLRITDRIRRIVEHSNTSKITINVSNSMFGDPDPTLLKTATVIYKIDSKYCIANALENHNLVIEESSTQCYSIPTDDKVKIKIYVASWSGVDVTSLLRSRMAINGLNKMSITDLGIGKTNLDYRWLKAFVCLYELNGQLFIHIIKENLDLDFVYEEQKRKEKEITDGTYFNISHASYGPLEVTDKVKIWIDRKNSSLSFKPENKLFGNTWVGNSPKYSHVFYLLHDRICVANAVEYGEINIGINKPAVCYDEPGITKSGIKIEAAAWGDKDVTEVLRKKSYDPNFSTIFAEDSFFGDPLKTLSIQFVVNGKRFNRVLKEHEVLDLFKTEFEERDSLVKQTKAEEELMKKIESQNYAIKAKEDIIAKAVQTEKQKEDLLRLQEDEKSKLNEDKIALQNKQKEIAAQAVQTSSNQNETIIRKKNIERVYLNKLAINVPRGTPVRNNAIVVITHINTGANLYTSSSFKNFMGENYISGYAETDLDNNLFWEIHGNKPLIQNLDNIKLRHRSTLSYLYSRKGRISNLNGEQDLVSVSNGLDSNTDWKIVVVHNYGDDQNLKVGDIFKIKHLNSELYLNGSEKQDLVTKNKIMFVKTSAEEKENDLFVITDLR